MKKEVVNKNDIISVANLPESFTIDDPKEYIRFIRSTFLKTARELNQLSIKEVSRRLQIKEKELIRIESGQVKEQDMMFLNKICELYKIDYPSILFMYKLAGRPNNQKIEKMAAYHDQKMDEETQKELVDFLLELKDTIE